MKYEKNIANTLIHLQSKYIEHLEKMADDKSVFLQLHGNGYKDEDCEQCKKYQVEIKKLTEI